MTQQPTVTVIMPLYNGQAYCEQTLRSVIDQEYPPAEIIIVDDGSTDRSVEIVSGVECDIPIKVVEQPNQGQSAARNEGASVASGELLAFIDQDDLWHPHHLRALVSPFAGRSDLGWAYSDFDEIDEQSRTVTRRFIAQHAIEHPRNTLASFIASDLMILPSATVMRAEALHAVGGFDRDLCGYEDDDLFIRMFRAGWDSEFVGASLTKFRVHQHSASASTRFLASRVTFFEKLIVDIPDDTRHNRYYIRDLLFPRLFQATLSEYRTALIVGDFELARVIGQTAARLGAHVPGGRRRALEFALLDHPELFHRLLKVQARLPRRLRPSINPALVLR